MSDAIEENIKEEGNEKIPLPNNKEYQLSIELQLKLGIELYKKKHLAESLYFLSNVVSTRNDNMIGFYYYAKVCFYISRGFIDNFTVIVHDLQSLQIDFNKEAFTYSNLAARFGCDKSKFILARCYELGVGTDVNIFIPLFFFFSFHNIS